MSIYIIIKVLLWVVFGVCLVINADTFYRYIMKYWGKK